MMRLRQLALVAADLEPALDSLGSTLGVELCFRDPGVAEFGLHNGLLAIGDTFLEVVSPVQDGTTAGRLLDKRGGDGGYMVIVQTTEYERVAGRLPDLGVRVVWRHESAKASSVHLHPKDLGGPITSIDAMADEAGWLWAGPTWRDHVRTGTVAELSGAVIAAEDPDALAARWAEVLDRPPDGRVIRLDRGRIVFESAGARGAGLDAIEVTVTDRSRAGEVHQLVGTEFRFV
ncbi:MAG: VOC family protein [Acidimicrobiales bacterium]